MIIKPTVFRFLERNQRKRRLAWIVSCLFVKLAQNSGLVRTYRSSSAENYSDFELQNFRDSMMLKLSGLDPKILLNADEVGCFY